VMCFVGFNHEVRGGMIAPVGWNMLGNNYDTRTTAVTLWRKNFTGRSVTIPSFPDQCSVAVTLLCEFVMP